jgi:multiple sugar transport system substrate-binding protein/putative spermidine/putrescine transport system substrate-binding protein
MAIPQSGSPPTLLKEPRMQLKCLAASAAVIAAMTGAAHAADVTGPAFGDTFNVTDTSVDLSQLTRENFYDVLVPLAKKDGEMTFYSYWPPAPLVVFQNQIIPAFEKKYGIKVHFNSVETNVGLPQLDAAYKEGKPSPMDGYFSSDLPADLNEMANIRLTDILPNAADIDPSLAYEYRGIEHNGAYVPFHGNQTVIAFNSAFVKGDEVPQTFEDLLAYSKANPGKVAITSPLRGGSGSGFLTAVSHKLMSDDCVARWMDLSADEAAADKLVNNSECFAPVWAYFNDLLETAQITNGNTDTLNLMANGVANVGTAWEDLTFSYVMGNQLPDTVRVTILNGGQPGGAEGAFIPSNTANLAAALLFMDEILAPEHQAWKLAGFASRSPKTELDASLIPAEAQKHLVPADIYEEGRISNANPVMSRVVRDAFAANVLDK